MDIKKKEGSHALQLQNVYLLKKWAEISIFYILIHILADKEGIFVIKFNQ